ELVNLADAAARRRVALIEDCEPAPAILAHGFDEMHARSCAHRAAQRSLAFVFGPVRQVRHEIDAETAAACEDAVDRRERGGEIALAHERLQDPVRGHHESEAAIAKR